MKSAIYLLSSIFILSCACNSLDRNKINIDKERRFHQKILTIDSHTDTPLNLMRRGQDLSVKSSPEKDGSKIDFRRMKEGDLDGAFFAVFVGQGPRTPEGNEKAMNTALEIFDTLHAVIKRNHDIVMLGLNAGDLGKINRQGKLAIYIGIENGYVIGSNISLIRKYYDLGARYITLCHSENNDICDSSTGREGAEHAGLSESGKEVVMEMNRLGMMVDVSHVSDKTFYDVLKITTAPVIASHSCARALCNHPRNLNDSMLVAIAKNGGVVQVCMVGEYIKEIPDAPERDSARHAVIARYGNYYNLSPDKQEEFIKAWVAVDSIFPPVMATVSDFVNHIDHIVSVAGIDHVGIGTDFDGGGELEDCYDVSQMENITFELLKRGYSRSDIRKIWSGNLLRVLREVEKKRGEE